MLKNFRSYQLAVHFYQTTQALRLPNGLRDQLGRAASSVALNLAEGSGKSSRKDRLRYYEIALGSIRECEAIMDLTANQHPTTKANLEQLARHTYNLCKSLRRE